MKKWRRGGEEAGIKVERDERTLWEKQCQKKSQ